MSIRELQTVAMYSELDPEMLPALFILTCHSSSLPLPRQPEPGREEV